jgi:hypothetical protein
MRYAVIIAALSFIGVAVASAETLTEYRGLPVKILRVRVDPNPVITADMLNPKPTYLQAPMTMASVETH